MYGVILCKDVANVLGVGWALGDDTKDPVVRNGRGTHILKGYAYIHE